jgi:hypothetical protein
MFIICQFIIYSIILMFIICVFPFIFIIDIILYDAT